MDFVIKTAKTVQEAVNEGIKELGITEAEAEIEVLEEPKGGFLGILGSKDAIVKIKKKEDISSFVRDLLYDKEEKKPKKVLKKTQKKFEDTAEIIEEKPVLQREKVVEKPVSEEVNSKIDEVTDEVFEKDSFEEQEQKPKREILDIWNDIEIKNHSEEFLSKILDNFGINYSLLTTLEKNNLNVEIRSENVSELGVVIGKHGITLDSLQYLLSLVVNKHREEFIRVSIDSNNYRDKRRKTLENLARKSVEKVKKYKRPIKLEPMNPSERRIIHLILQDYEGISTYSEGKDPYRRVVIASDRHNKR